MQRKVAIITGATKGIGFSIAQSLAQMDMDLIINGFGSKEEIEYVVRTLESYKVTCKYFNCDLQSSDNIKSMVNEGLKHFGKIDVLVNNAGIQHVSELENFPDDKWEMIIKINLTAAFHMTKGVIPGMKKNQWGRIINIASAHGLVASPFKSAYVASKHGMLGFTKSIALELASFGITANTICPGYVNTDLLKNQITDTAKVQNISEDKVLEQVILKPQAIKQLIEPSDISSLVCFLCREEARCITGSSLSIDGGWTAQ